jgi:hypothetical protein
LRTLVEIRDSVHQGNHAVDQLIAAVAAVVVVAVVAVVAVVVEEVIERVATEDSSLQLMSTNYTFLDLNRRYF